MAIYPVKGLRGIALDHAEVERCGLAQDRRWAVVRPGGVVWTQRDLPGMARIGVQLEGAGLRLEAPGQGGVGAAATGEAAVVEVWRTRVPAVAASPEASAWLSRVLGTDCTLVYMADPAARAVTPDLARPGDVVSLADGFPLLVTTTASLAALNAELGAPVPMTRFRPNLVVDGAEAWDEDGWAHLEAGGVRLRLTSACARCKVTTIDQVTGEPTPRLEPLRTLGRIRRGAAGDISFGWNAVPETLGTVAVGASLTALHR